jgi:hypothetical protein
MIIPEDKEQFLRELQDTIHALETKLGQSQFVRPFVCAGELTACDVFIVGVNPREDMEFRPYWDGISFNKAAWEDEYQRQRLSRTGSKSMSPTRTKLNLICEGASPANVLETNLYPVATSTERILRRDPARQNDAIFALLLRRLQPRVVITHGTTARDRVVELLALQENEVQEAMLHMKAKPSNPAQFTKARPRAWGDSPVVYLKALRHLGRNYSYDFMRQLGERVREIVAVEAVSATNSNRH